MKLSNSFTGSVLNIYKERVESILYNNVEVYCKFVVVSFLFIKNGNFVKHENLFDNSSGKVFLKKLLLCVRLTISFHIQL